MKQTIEQIQQDIADEFGGIDDWMDRYGYIIDMVWAGKRNVQY